MSEIPGDLKFLESHEWARLEEDGVVRVGITEHAQEQLGDVVYVELPEVDDEAATSESLAVVESVKAASDIFPPVAGVVVAVNGELEDQPERVNADPYGEGWLFAIKPEDPSELDALMDAEAYAAFVASEG